MSTENYGYLADKGEMTTMSDKSIDKLAGIASHTPGPWEATKPALSCEIHANKIHVASAFAKVPAGTSDRYILEPEAEANARLIAAAPELLEALKETLRALESHLNESTRDHNLGNVDLLCPCSQNEVVRAKAAIAKALGR